MVYKIYAYHLLMEKKKSSLCENVGNEDSIVEGLIPKKVRFRDKDEITDSDMLIDPSAE